jgi:hypothetical protein
MARDLFDQRGSAVLSENECRRLLASSHGRVGRLGFHEDDRIAIRPVNFMPFDDHLLFRMGPGSMLDFLMREREVAFETDLIEAESYPPKAWSVTAYGRMNLITEPLELGDAVASGLTPLVAEPGEVYVLMRVASIAGRRFEINPLARPHLGAVTAPSGHGPQPASW